jgi:hypothetical protein
MRSTKETIRAVFARHPRPWKVVNDETVLDSDGVVVEILAEDEELALVVATTEGLNRLDTEDLDGESEALTGGEVV